MLKWIILGFIIIVFPFFIRLDIIFNNTSKKLFVKVYIFGIMVLKSYAELINEGVIFHLTKRKAVIFPFKNAVNIRKKFKPIKDFHFINFDFLIEIGNDKQPMNAFTKGFLINYLYQNVKWFLYHKKPYLDVNTIIKIYNEEVFNIYNSTTIVFNLLIIIISFIKIIVEKVFYALKHRKQ